MISHTTLAPSNNHIPSVFIIALQIMNDHKLLLNIIVCFYCRLAL